MSPQKMKELQSSTQYYLDTEGEGLLGGNSETITKKVIEENHRKRKTLNRKKFKYGLDVKILELERHPRFDNPAVKRFRKIVNKQIQIMNMKESQDARIIRK